ncbi:MAG: nitroreductase [Acidobacteria bacterium]|jgi:nitroreductase|nr:nitroreductase [Acidobacteriota bacterium]
MDAITCLKTRRSIRAYAETPVAQDILEDIVDCARLAPTAMNRQPWTFIAIREQATRQRLAAIVEHAPFLAQAPVCVAVFCAGSEFWVEDGSAAIENLLLAAHAHGLGACWVAGYQLPYTETIRELLGGPPDARLLALVTVGYAAESPAPDKRALADVLRWERFGK